MAMIIRMMVSMDMALLLLLTVDMVVSEAVGSDFISQHKCQITTMPGGEHWFHTPEQLAFMRTWEDGIIWAFKIYDELPLRYEIQDFKWYFTTDPYFNRFKRSNTAKLYRADKEEVNRHLRQQPNWDTTRSALTPSIKSPTPSAQGGTGEIPVTPTPDRKSVV